MTTQEAWKECNKSFAFVKGGQVAIFNHDTHEYDKYPIKPDLEAIEVIEKALKVLEIFKKYLYIRINEKPSFDDTYLVALQEDEEQECDYTCIFVNEEEKELIKGWLKNDQ